MRGWFCCAKVKRGMKKAHKSNPLRFFLQGTGFAAALLCLCVLPIAGQAQDEDGPYTAAGDPFDPYSPGGLPQSCDSEFMETLNSRAWLAGQRDVENAEALIRKQDSVLQYSCFDTMAYALGGAAQTLFSNNIFNPYVFRNQSWEPRDLFQPTIVGTPGPFGSPDKPSVGRPEDMSYSTILGINLVVGDALSSYYARNFNYTLGGGASDISGFGGVCGVMRQIWDFMQCGNFAEASFKTLKEFSETDPRQLPFQCNALDPAFLSPSRAQKWAEHLLTAYPAAASPPEDGGMEAVDMLLAPLSPSSCVTTSIVIPTGLVVKDAEGNSHADAICTGIGCTYVPNVGCR